MLQLHRAPELMEEGLVSVAINCSQGFSQWVEVEGWCQVTEQDVAGDPHLLPSNCTEPLYVE